MIRGRQLTAIIPVRGGSKGIPGKNLHRVGNDKLAKRCSYIDRVFVSTDHPEMYVISQKYGVAMPLPRPADLATDRAKTVDVVLQAMDATAITDGYVVLIQATSPLRTLEDLNGFCKAFDEDASGGRAIVTVVRHDAPHPDKIQKVEGGFVSSYLGKDSMVARQTLPEVYSLNGAFYLTDIVQLRSSKSFMPHGATLPYVMPHERSINLDNMFDVQMMDALLEKGILKAEDYD
jgi:CMP-N,N'-diacetyllegionaminic acid synthase